MSLKTENPIISPDLPRSLYPLYHNYIEQFKDHPEIANKISNILLLVLKKVENIQSKVESEKWPIVGKPSKITKKPMTKYYLNQIKHFRALEKKYVPFSPSMQIESEKNGNKYPGYHQLVMDHYSNGLKSERRRIKVKQEAKLEEKEEGEIEIECNTESNAKTSPSRNFKIPSKPGSIASTTNQSPVLHLSPTAENDENSMQNIIKKAREKTAAEPLAQLNRSTRIHTNTNFDLQEIDENAMQIWRVKWAESCEKEHDGADEILQNEQWQDVNASHYTGKIKSEENQIFNRNSRQNSRDSGDPGDIQCVTIGLKELMMQVDSKRTLLFKKINKGVLRGKLKKFVFPGGENVAKFGVITDITDPSTGKRILKEKEPRFKYPAEYKFENSEEEDFNQRLQYLRLNVSSHPLSSPTVTSNFSKNRYLSTNNNTLSFDPKLSTSSIREFRTILSDLKQARFKNDQKTIAKIKKQVVKLTSPARTKYSVDKYNPFLSHLRDYSDIEELRKEKDEFVGLKDETGSELVDLVFYHENEIENLRDFGEVKDGMIVEFKVEIGVELSKVEAAEINIMGIEKKVSTDDGVEMGGAERVKCSEIKSEC